MSKQSPHNTKKSYQGMLIMGLGFLALGSVSFLLRGEPLTINDLVFCILTAGLTFLLLPIFMMVLLLMASSPIIGVIFVLLGLIFLWSQPAYATGIGITITSIGLMTIAANNQNNSN